MKHTLPGGRWPH